MFWQTKQQFILWQKTTTEKYLNASFPPDGYHAWLQTEAKSFASFTAPSKWWFEVLMSSFPLRGHHL